MERRLTVPEHGLSVMQDRPEEELLNIAHVFKVDVDVNKSEVLKSSKIISIVFDAIDKPSARAA